METVENLLCRNAVENDMNEVKTFIKNRVVMVTGGAGSIGSELCRQALDFGCELLLIYDFNENGLYETDEEFKDIYAGKYKLCLASVCDMRRLNNIIKEYKPHAVFHAAAHKHVPLTEENIFETVKNNIAGTVNVINSCIKNNVEKFILLSSDKAVNPVSIMGASKRITEMIVQNQSNEKLKNKCVTELAAVRFGNVMGSNGSVIPKFIRQIKSGGPVTLTHMDMVRYFMTIPEAVNLVLTAGTFAKGGEIFVLDMGEPVKIYDLAVNLIKMAGFEPDVDIKIKITGIRPGEKLYEELFLNDETVDKTSHEKIFILKSCNIKNFDAQLNNILNLAEKEQDEELLKSAVFGLAGEEI